MTPRAGSAADRPADGAPSPDRDRRAETLTRLSAETVELARSLPGPLRRLAVRRGPDEIEIEGRPTGVDVDGGPSTGLAPAGPDVGPQPPAPEMVVDVDTEVIRAPLVGTFYRAPEPGAAPFVEVGDIVEPGQTVAIVEAMKLMNRIVAETHGRIIEICVSDGEPVEYERTLLRIGPLDTNGEV
ncbi:MAG: acetyl-CoA carboxylase biotin carboxyl carrier protein [Acidimicrobiales bacterium]